MEFFYFCKAPQKIRIMKAAEALELIKKNTGITDLTEVPIENFFPEVASYSTDEDGNLIGLCLVEQNIADVTFLKEIKSLTELHLLGNAISDISALGELTNLQVLNISDNSIVDISVLKELKNLQELSFNSNPIIDFPYFLKDLSYLEKIEFLPNPYQIKNIEYLTEIFSSDGMVDIKYNELSFFKQIAITVEKQILERENWINLKIPKDFERVFSQYLLLFKDFVAVVKSKTIDFYLRSEGESLLLISNGNTNINRIEIVNYLEEYISLLSKDLKNYHFQVENRDIDSPEVRKEIDLFILRHEAQVGVLRQEMRILEIENKDLRQEIERFETQTDEYQKRLVFLENRLYLALQIPQDNEKTTIYCEGENANLLSSIGFAHIHFLPDFDKSNVFMRMENNAKIYGIIDRDFLTDEEKQILEQKYPTLLILNYYCFENYLYHPDNLEELEPNFDKEAYIGRIWQKKEEMKYELISKLKNDRASYLFFRKNMLNTNEQKHLKPLFDMIDSDDFEIFYKIFSMKTHKDLCKIKDIGKKENLLVTGQTGSDRSLKSFYQKQSKS